MPNTNMLSEKLEFVEKVVEYTQTKSLDVFEDVEALAHIIAIKEKRFIGKSISYMFETLRRELLGV